MTGPEQGFLLLTSQLGNPERKPLTVAQLRILASRASLMQRPETAAELTAADLMGLGYGEEMAKRIVSLFDEEALLHHYLRQGVACGCVPLTRVTQGYPAPVRQRLGLDSPGSLWCKGDLALLDTPKISLVGSRVLNGENRYFAREVGRQAALQGYTLVSGNAAGADCEAQQACLEAGGSVIAVVATQLQQHRQIPRVLYLAEDGYDQPFSAHRALSRNRVIHCLGEKTFVAQATLEKGGTWDGCVRNLRFAWSPIFCYHDGSYAMKQLEQMGAQLIGPSDLRDFSVLKDKTISLF